MGTEIDYTDNQRLLEDAGWRYVRDERNTDHDCAFGAAPTFHWIDPDGKDWWNNWEVPILTKKTVA